MGMETHVFAWETGDAGEREADYFYPISIRDKEKILDRCRAIGINGICSIGSDLAMHTVNYIADCLDLVGNSMSCTEKTTNKFKMREAFRKNGDPSPWSMKVHSVNEVADIEKPYPIIVKPTDRSGSRGVTKVEIASDLEKAVEDALEQSFDKEVVIEEYISGKEYSVECISWEGEHFFIAVTKKFTTGAPHFIEIAHLEPAGLSYEITEKIKKIVFHALDSLEISFGASHSEIMISDNADISIIEIGARMGGDLIGSDLVSLSTGVDYVEDVIRVALGCKPLVGFTESGTAAVRYIIDDEDIRILERIRAEKPEILIKQEMWNPVSKEILDSSARKGCYIISSGKAEDVLPYLPVG